MGTFMACKGKSACRDDGTRCLTCGRSLEEITRLRELIDGLSTLALDQQYYNLNDYLNYVINKTAKTIVHRQKGEISAD
ncbi:MAG: hypothetical protein ABW090_05525 [Sedimenticola sp.]